MTAHSLPLARDGPARSAPVTFLFADIRGFTRFTERRGAEAAARLADAFVSLVVEVASDQRGRPRGTWGDQVLVEFASPRDAVRAAVDLQARCLEATLSDPSVPIPVGVGLDVGEPADAGEAQSAAALNLAARLCARARPGEVLASSELVHLAGAVDGVTYVDRGTARFKGLPGTTRVVLVRDEAVDRQLLRRFRETVGADHDGRRRLALAWTAALIVVALGLTLAGFAIVRSGDAEPVSVPPGGLAVVDVESGQLVDAAALGGTPEGMTFAAGDLWVTQAGADSVARLDPETGRIVQTIAVGRVPVAVAVVGDDVWVVNSRAGTVSRVSTTTNRVVQTVVAVGNQPVAIAAGFGSLWVANHADATATRIDPRTGRVSGRVPVGRGPAGVAVGAGAVWVTNARDGTVSPIDPRTMDAEAPVPVGTGPKGIAVGRSGVWVANRLDLTVSRVDPESRQETARIPVGDSPFGIAAGDGTVWVGAGAAGTLVEIDPIRQAVRRSVPIGASPYGVWLGGDRVWAATRPFASARHAGGTLTVATASISETFDPAVDFDYDALTLVHDGLVGYRRATGADNFDLVPDLAVAIPKPADGGRTYTFRVRPGISYSDGRMVEPADFRRGIERQFTATAISPGGSPASYDKIVGAGRCLGRAERCDLSEGIVTDHSTVTFRLTEPDPEFVYKMALPPASPVPPGTPADPREGMPVLGTGPYAVAEFVPGELLRLERNRHFSSWSASARPPGYPDTIRWRLRPPSQLVREVEAGRADVVPLFFVPPAAADDVALRLPAQVQEDLTAFTVWVALDTSRPPFDRVAARRAVALALDRGRMAETLRLSPDQAACGLLPPGFPGYEVHCPFTAHPRAGQPWQAPDLPRARQLVGRSGTIGMPVEVYWGSWDPPFAAAGRDMTRTLDRLGYDARLHPLKDWPTAQQVERLNVTVFGWFPDYPFASNFFLPHLSCDALAAGANYSKYCNPDLDALADRASRLGESDPGQADRLWQRVYRTLTDEAVVVPIAHGSETTIVSERLGNYQAGDFFGPLYDQMWVR